MRAPMHPNNKERLRELSSYRILDTPQSADFDSIVGLVKRLCDVPVALVTLVDKDRQWAKAVAGVDVVEVPFKNSICAHAILEDGFVEIPDLQADPRTSDNPFCIGPEAMRFYAGAPLLSRSGLPLGTLCVLDRKPRSLTPDQRAILEAMAGQTARLMELHRTLHIETILRDEMDHRVKNSLQSVLSVLRIYRGQVEDETAREAFDSVGRRIEAVAALHEALYSYSEDGEVGLRPYIEGIVASLSDGAPPNVSLRADVVDWPVRSRVAVNLAIIISEFTANAIKHAFPDDRIGHVDVVLRRDDDGTLRLDCSDDGIGSTGGGPVTPISRAGRLGLRLMQSAADQLSAHMETQATDAGYRLTLTLGEDALSGRPAAAE